ncbi:MAG: hypothetical protein F4Y86_00745 [Gammaproteobacteria bacterium]|nr:hypothetical protein [Gammaproteobacteria bacterium]
MKAWVPKVRAVVQRDFRGQLERLGLEPSGKHTPLAEMALPQEARVTRERVEAFLAREAMAEGTAERGYANALREFTYTLLNRLVGLKAMEVRELLYLPPPANPDASVERTEVVSPISGQTRSRYLRDFRAAGGSRYKYQDDAEEALLRDALTTAFRHVTLDIRVLFDPDHEHACIWPTHAILVEVFRSINEDLPEDAYRAQDFLGWVYQFFNTEEKKRVRDENRGIPRSSYELAVINQFYTPSWVVKTLVDNTLGRLWLQMHPDSSLRGTAPPPLPGERTSDVPVADYLVPHTGENIRFQQVTETAEVLSFKRARDITLIDPACGTMHFGQYAFGLFHRMYLDEIEHAGQEGWPAAPSVTDPREIPAAILENNLFGIDIDPRAIQIASLSLMLTAKEAALRDGLSPTGVKVKRSNLVVANAVDLDEDRLRGLIDGLSGRSGSQELGERLFNAIWENLQNIGEVGSLVRVAEEITQSLNDWVEGEARAKGLTDFAVTPPGAQLELGSIKSDADRAIAKQHALERQVLEQEALILRLNLLSAVEAEAGRVAVEPSERLFAEDTARRLKLVQFLSRRYDIVVMNPPYGSFVPKVKDTIKVSYPLTSNDIYAAFVDRACQLTEPDGYVGALLSATFVNLKTFENLRSEILLKRNPLLVMLDLGFGILDDATVEAAAIVLHGGTP